MFINEARQNYSKVASSLADHLDIPDELYEKAKESYKEVTRWLASGAELGEYELDLFPQGSFKLGTVVQPVNEDDDYDIDLICIVEASKVSMSPKKLWQMIGDRLGEHDFYRTILKEKDRCWRLNYSGEFHMDILPAIPNPESDNGGILVPSKEMAGWRPSNPRGFAEWFESRQRYIREFLEKRAAQIEPVPPNKRIKTPLQRSIQLLKRHRDIMFSEDVENKPISMIITTLAGWAYQGEEDIADALERILSDMPRHIAQDAEGDRIENPVDSDENFADKWKKEPQRRANFYRWLEQARIVLGNAQQFSTHNDIATSMRKSFGDALIDESLSDFETAHLPVLKEEYLPALYYAEHKEEPEWDFDIQGKAKILARYDLDGKKRKLPSNWRKLPKGVELKFKAIVRGISQPYKIYWQVVNTGEDARNANGLRGGFDDETERVKEGSRVWPEYTGYTGSHSIECYIVKDNVCVAQSDVFIVNVL